MLKYICVTESNIEKLSIELNHRYDDIYLYQEIGFDHLITQLSYFKLDNKSNVTITNNYRTKVWDCGQSLYEINIKTIGEANGI
jgi:hypothetical protein